MVTVVMALIVVGVLLWLLNQYAGSYIDGKILKIINAFVVICVIFYLLYVFGILSAINTIPVPRVR